MNLQELIEHPELLGTDSLCFLHEVVERYPYFQLARLLYLKNLYVLDDPKFESVLHNSVIYITDRTFLYYMLEGAAVKETSRVPSSAPGLSENVQGDRTLTLIDAFLAQQPDESSPLSWKEDASADYVSHLLNNTSIPATVDASEPVRESVVVPMRGQDLIDQFIEKAEDNGMRIKLAKEEQTTSLDVTALENDSVKFLDEDTGMEEDGYFTETLAKIYIKQQRYTKALEIIKKLSLKYPKKNIYFADQIRFLEKLIINTKSK